MFVYFWEIERKQGRGREREKERERETQNPKQAPGSGLSAQSPMRGSNSQAVRPWPEPKSDAQLTEPPRRPSTVHSLKRREALLKSRGRTLSGHAWVTCTPRTNHKVQGDKEFWLHHWDLTPNPWPGVEFHDWQSLWAHTEWAKVGYCY